jgi:hypothetical protein
MALDPRLANETLLRLAAFRLQNGPRPLLPSWQETDGLAALLAYASRLPPCAPEDVPGVREDAPGLGGLLWAARQWQQEHGDERRHDG